VLLIQRTLHFSATSKNYFSQLTIPLNHSLYIWESSLHSNAIIEKLILKTAAMIDGGLLNDATQMKLDVLSARH
jgi:hypothetical protein